MGSQCVNAQEINQIQNQITPQETHKPEEKYVQDVGSQQSADEPSKALADDCFRA
jgi:hypothetical protein